MKSIALLLLTLIAMPLAAADLALSMRHVVAKTTGDSGDLDIPLSRGFGASAELFWSEHFSVCAAATLVNPEAILFPLNPPPHDIDLGTLGLDFYTITARWHIAPERRLSAFAGAGGALVQIGNLDDRFGEAFEADFDSESSFVVEGGLRYRVSPRVFFELGAMYVPLEAEPRIRFSNDPSIQLPAKLGIDPVIVSIGAGWRF